MVQILLSAVISTVISLLLLTSKRIRVWFDKHSKR